jgi:hypothetical protein
MLVRAYMEIRHRLQNHSMSMNLGIKLVMSKRLGLAVQSQNEMDPHPRATSQVNKENKNREGTRRLSGVVVKKNVQGRRKGLDVERKQAEMRRKQGHSMKMHKRP